MFGGLHCDDILVAFGKLRLVRNFLKFYVRRAVGAACRAPCSLGAKCALAV